MSLCLLAATRGRAEEPDETSTRPVQVYASYKGDWVSNFSGGIQSGSTYLGLADLFVEFDTKAAGWWKGGTFMVHGANTHGGEPSAGLIGDFQVVSNIEAGNHTFLYELWYTQMFGNIHTTIGLQDLNVEFANSDIASVFLNSSFGIHSVIADNVTAPIFPLTSPGITICWDACEHFNLKTSVYKGCPIDFEENPHNLKWNLNHLSGLLWVTEANFHCSQTEDYSETIKVGAFFHQHCNDEEVINSGTGKNLEYDYGFYLVGDHRISAPNESGKGLDVFYQLGVSPRNDNAAYLGSGFTYTGLFSKIGNDVLGLAMARAILTNDAGKDETTVECFYKTQITKFFYLQPDVQYVIHPEGTDIQLNNALVGIIRMGLEF